VDTRNLVVGSDCSKLWRSSIFGNLPSYGTPYLFLLNVTVEDSHFKFGPCLHNLSWGVAGKKNNLQNQNWWVSVRGAPQKLWDPLLFLQPLNLTASNLVHNVGSGNKLPRTTFKTTITGV